MRGVGEMSDFYNRVKEICNKYKKVAMFIDMDGTIVEYNVYPEGTVTAETKGLFVNNRPIKIIIDKLRKISEIENIDLYILSMARSYIIVKEKKEWLKKHADFIDKDNYIIINREAGDYNNENRNRVKSERIQEKLKEYNHAIFLDDYHKVIHEAVKILKDKCDVFHISSVII